MDREKEQERERDRTQAGEKAEGEGEAVLPLSWAPDLGLNPRTRDHDLRGRQCLII